MHIQCVPLYKKSLQSLTILKCPYIFQEKYRKSEGEDDTRCISQHTNLEPVNNLQEPNTNEKDIRNIFPTRVRMRGKNTF